MDSSLSTSRRPARAAVSNQHTSRTSKTSKTGTAGTEPEPDWSESDFDEHQDDLAVIRSLQETLGTWDLEEDIQSLHSGYPDLVTAYHQLRRTVNRALASNNSQPRGSGRREARNTSRPDTNGRPVAPDRVQQDGQVQTRPAPDAQAGHSQATLSRPQQPQLSSIRSEPASTLSAPRSFVTPLGHQYEIPISKRERRANVDAPAEEDDIIPALNDDGIAIINTAPGIQRDSSRDNDDMERSSSRRSARVLNRSLGATPHAAAKSSSSRMTPHNPSSPAYGSSRKRRRVDEDKSEDKDDNDDEHAALHSFGSAQTFGDDDITPPEADNEATLEATAKRKKS